MERIDTHFHIWDLEANSYPWLQEGEPVVRTYGSSAPLRKSYRWADYLNDCIPSGVTSGIYIQANMRDPVEEARYVGKAIEERPDGFDVAIVGYSNLWDSSAAALIQQLADITKVCGIRTTVAWHEDAIFSFAPRPDMLDESAAEISFACIAELGLRLDCMLYAAQMKSLSAIAARHPTLPIIVNHTGMPVEKGDLGLCRWREGMQQLAERPNVSLKISGLGMIWCDWTSGRADVVLNEAIDIFGEDRCVFGSNYPVERLSSSYDAMVDAFQAAIGHRSVDAQQKIFRDNAARIYGLGGNLSSGNI